MKIFVVADGNWLCLLIFVDCFCDVLLTSLLVVSLARLWVEVALESQLASNNAIGLLLVPALSF